MIKLIFCVRRRPELSLAEFQRYWLDDHGPLVRKHAGVLGIRRYVQMHALPGPLNEALRKSRDASEPYDGAAELWWESVEAMAAATGSAEGREAGRELLEDERKFIDLAHSALWVGEEHEVVGG